MNQKKWDEMTDQQKHDYLSTGEIKIAKRIGVRADSKVNSDEPAVICFLAYCNDIQVSNEHETSTGAMEEAIANIKALAT